MFLNFIDEKFVVHVDRLYTQQQQRAPNSICPTHYISADHVTLVTKKLVCSVVR
jgi:hypothetical protein